MSLRCVAAMTVAITIAVTVGARAVANVETMTVPTFGTVTIYKPDAPPQQVVLFISGDGGWNLGVVGMAERLRGAGALVVGIDVRAFVRSLESSQRCAYPAGALEELARAVQLRYKLPRYHRPILIGYSSGATLAYAALAAAPSETFAGAISLGFCPDLELNAQLCQMRGLKFVARTGARYDLAPFAQSSVPWMVLQGESDQVCAPDVTRAFVAATGSARLFSLPKVGHGFGVPANWEPQFLEAYRTVANASTAKERPPATAQPVADLPLVEVPTVGRENGDAMVVLLTGDGGWADLDKHVAAGLSAHGVPVVAWSSLEYYWTPRTPEGAAADLRRIVDHYAVAWHRPRVFIVGYSFGADIAPFLVNRLPLSARARVAGLTLLGPSTTASFTFHLTDWLKTSEDPRYPVVPEMARTAAPVTCVSGSDEIDSACHKITGGNVRVAFVGRGHHFSDQYGQLVDVVLRQIAGASTSERLDTVARLERQLIGGSHRAHVARFE